MAMVPSLMLSKWYFKAQVVSLEWDPHASLAHTVPQRIPIIKTVWHDNSKNPNTHLILIWKCRKRGVSKALLFAYNFPISLKKNGLSNIFYILETEIEILLESNDQETNGFKRVLAMFFFVSPTYLLNKRRVGCNPTDRILHLYELLRAEAAVALGPTCQWLFIMTTKKTSGL
jgi:hypothetical protein